MQTSSPGHHSKLDQSGISEKDANNKSSTDMQLGRVASFIRKPTLAPITPIAEHVDEELVSCPTNPVEPRLSLKEKDTADEGTIKEN